MNFWTFNTSRCRYLENELISRAVPRECLEATVFLSRHMRSMKLK